MRNAAFPVSRFTFYLLEAEKWFDKFGKISPRSCNSKFSKINLGLEHKFSNVVKLKKNSNKLSIRKRFLARTSNERIMSEKLEHYFMSVCNIVRNQNLSRKTKKLFNYLYIRIEPNVFMLRTPKLSRTIDSFTESECWNYFETRRQDLPRLRTALLLDRDCILSNGIRMTGEEIMLRGLYELVSRDDQYIIANEIFGKDQPAQSRAFSFFINHVYSHFQDILTDNLE